MRKYLYPATTIALFTACATFGFGKKPAPIDDHNPYVLNLETAMLQAATAGGDHPLSDCAVEMLPTGTKQYKCVVHFMGDYQALLTELTTLQDQLKSCQAGH